MRKPVFDICVIGFALFSMFFGAGNVIFPPYLGLGCGSSWFAGFAWYYLADIGLALLAMFAILRCGSTDKLVSRIGSVPAKLLLSAITLCIGPMLAIPRTAATTHEMALTPLVGDVSPVLFSVLFFALIFAMCVKQSAVVDIVGKLLTPALLLGLLVLIVLGLLDPMGPLPTDRVLVESVAGTGIEAGYQTMDVLAAILFGIIIPKSAEDKGYSGKKKVSVVAGASLVAGGALMAVYLGLTYLGATTSDFFDLSVQRSALMVAIVEDLMGKSGLWLFALIVALACITTAAALVSSSADFFSSLLKVSYQKMVLVMCVFSAVAANFGLDTIVSIAAPILNIVYPPTLVVVCMSFLEKWLPDHTAVRCAAAGALVVSAAQTAGLWMALPLSAQGFGWLVPAAVCGLVGFVIGRCKRA